MYMCVYAYIFFKNIVESQMEIKRFLMICTWYLVRKSLFSRPHPCIYQQSFHFTYLLTLSMFQGMLYLQRQVVKVALAMVHVCS